MFIFCEKENYGSAKTIGNYNLNQEIQSKYTHKYSHILKTIENYICFQFQEWHPSPSLRDN